MTAIDAVAANGTIRLSFIDGISVEREANEIVLRNGTASLHLASRGDGELAAFHALCNGNRTEQQLGELVLEEDGIGGLTQFFMNFGRCIAAGLIRYTACDGATRLASCIPLVSSFRFRQAEIEGKRWTLSRFAWMRKRGDEFVLQSPFGFAEVVLHHDDALAFAARPIEHDSALAQIFWNAGALAEEDSESRDEVLRQWEFQDLLFHMQTRSGRHGKRFGGTFRHVGKIAPLPAAKPPTGGVRIALPRCDFDALVKNDAPFTAVLERRHSTRTHTAAPLTLEQLGEFLYRSARIRHIRGADVSGVRMELSSRPYPGGGAIHELELYITAHRCDGLPRALYHYDPLDHQLSVVRAYDDRVETLLMTARGTAGVQSSPDVLITIASRFQRMSWKYETIAYAVSLKNAGVLYQTFYLVATAMGLAACGLGNGDSQAFADATGLDPLVEGSIGEFMLGGPQ